MTNAEFRSMVVQNSRWFKGVGPETTESIRQAEQHLSCAIPPSMKWLLSTLGYSSACGVGSLDDTVTDTMSARRTLGLDERYVILNNWQDGGYVVMDTVKPDINGEYKIYWMGAHNLARLAEGQAMDDDVDVFEDFPAYVLDRLRAAKQED